MGTLLKRNDLKVQYPTIKQGMFIFEKEKHIPKEQPTINIGKEMSSALLKIEEGQSMNEDQRRTKLAGF